MSTIAVAIMCKTPAAGLSKTRLSPPLQPEECAGLSACFIRDLSHTIKTLAAEGGVTGYAVYTPRGSEETLRTLLPGNFRLMPQADGDFGIRLTQGIADLLGAGHAGAILVNSDSPTLPVSILREAVEALRKGNNVVLSRAIDGGYTLIGLSKLYTRLLEDIPWSTSDVYRLTLDRAREIGLPIVNVPAWYDVDDAESLDILQAELKGKPPLFNERQIVGAHAPETRRFLHERKNAMTGDAA